MAGNKAGLILQPRDRALLSELSLLRTIDREQAKIVAGFRSTTRVNARLLGLVHAGLLRRFFIGTVASGRRAIYTLSPKGAALVGAELRGIRRKPDKKVFGEVFVEHQLAVNGVLLAAKFHALTTPEHSFRGWRTFHSSLDRVETLIPDGYFEITSLAGNAGHFLEADLGTESLRVWTEKTAAYLAFAASGDFEKRFGIRTFRVLVAAQTQKRLDNIRRTVARSTDKIFWFSTFEQIHRDGIWSAIWQRPNGDQARSLIERSST